MNETTRDGRKDVTTDEMEILIYRLLHALWYKDRHEEDRIMGYLARLAADGSSAFLQLMQDYRDGLVIRGYSLESETPNHDQ